MSAISWVRPDVSGLFRRNIVIQLMKQGVIEDILTKVQLMVLFTEQLAMCG
jgi:hypothetical protein